MNWLRYRRRRWLAGFGLALGVVLACEFFTGPEPEIVVYNDHMQPLGSVRVGVGAVMRDFPALAPGESAALTLPLRAGGELGFWLPGDPPRRVAGPWLDPRETAQVVARINGFGEVVISVSPTWRAQLLTALR